MFLKRSVFVCVGGIEGAAPYAYETGLFDKLKRDCPEAVPFIIYVFIPQGYR